MTANKILPRRDTAANWAARNPVLAQGEIGFETDTRLLRVGDGATAWTSLKKVGVDLSASAGAGLVGLQQAGTGAGPRTVQDKLREIVSVTDFYANGVSGVAVDPTGNVDSTIGIQAAINATASGGRLHVPPGTYLVSNTLTIDSKDSITLIGDGGATGPVFRWAGTAQSTTPIIKIRRSSYCSVENIFLNCQSAGAAQCGYGVRITSEGSGVTQGNTIRNCTIQYASAYGVYIGDSNNLDQSVDINTVSNCFVNFCGSGSVSIHGSNTNLTRVERGAIATGPVCGIEVGTFARGVLIDQVMPYDATTTGLGWLYVRNMFSSQVVVRDCVMEQYNSPFLYTEASTTTNVATGSIVFENWISTCNFATASVLASYTQHGLLHLKNCYIGGRSDLTTTTITYQTPNFAGPGQRTFRIEDTVTYNSVSILCPSADNATFGSETTWKGNCRVQAGSATTAGRMQTFSRNDKPMFLAYLTTTQSNVTGTGTLYTVPFDTIVKNECNGYATGTNLFTAFCGGLYHFDIQVALTNVAAAMTLLQVYLVTSQRTYEFSQQVDAPIAGGRWYMSAAVEADMNANDQAYVQVAVSNGTGNTVAVNGTYGAPTVVGTRFSGHLVS